MNKEVPILKNKYFLYATEFFAGMSVMAVELGASRLLAPYFSSSQLVWTIIIGTIMIAMALGNIWGGRTADKNPDPATLYTRIIVAGLWVAAIPFVGKYIIAGLSLVVAMLTKKNFLVWAALACCLAIFVFPLMLLGTVTPSLAKYTMNNLENNALVIGQLGALNTIGSIIGTFLPTFVTIPAVGTAATFLIFAAVLILLGAAYFISAKSGGKKIAASFAVFIALALLTRGHSFAFWVNDLTYEGESIYNYLQVRETANSTILSTNVLFGVQSIKMNNDGLTGMYYDYALAAPAMAGLGEQDDGELLILGLGSGTYATLCESYYPNLKVDGVEIDEKIVALAQEYFDLPESVNVFVEDGRVFLSNSGLYDVIMVDAYQDITIPFQMSSVEFFTLVREHLKPGGVMVVNLNMRSGQEGAINDYLCDTVRAVFPAAYLATPRSGTNAILFAGEEEFVAAYIAQMQIMQNTELLSAAQRTLPLLQSVDAGELILTDDKAPVEVLGMRVIDEIIAEELAFYREALWAGDFDRLLSALS